MTTKNIADKKAARTVTALRKKRLDMAEELLREGRSPRLVLELLEAHAAFDAAPDDLEFRQFKVWPASDILHRADEAWIASDVTPAKRGGLKQITNEQAIARIKSCASRLRALVVRS